WKSDTRALLFASAGFSRPVCELPVTPKVLLVAMFRSNMNASKLEWATLPLNSRNGVRRGQVFALISVSANLPFGCSGKDIQNPFESEPAATLSRYVLSGLVIQKVDAVLSEGSRTSLACWPFPVARFSPAAARFVGTHGASGWHLVRIPRLCTNWLPCSTPSSKK